MRVELAIGGISTWTGDWLWGVPLILLNVTIHSAGLLAISWAVVEPIASRGPVRFPGLRFAVVMGIAGLLVTMLHAVEAVIWAFAYIWLDAVPDARSAMLYSLNAVTAYGHTDVRLAPNWQVLGALEALNGLMLFGLTTAFLFSVVHRVSPFGARQR
jgi:hypothetical protein